MKRILVNLVSESEFTVQGHGVHTAYLEMRHILESQPNVDLLINSKPLKETQITHIHTFGTFALRRLLSHKGGKKVVSAHVVPDSLVGSIVGAKLWVHFFKYYLRWFYNRADTVIAVSPATKDDLIRLGIHRPIVVIDNSIDTSKYSNSPAMKKNARQQLGLPQNKFTVIGNGQIQPRKRFDVFIKTAEQLPNVQFVWIGGIPFKVAGADFVKLNHLMKHHPKNVTITDVIPHAQARLYMQAGDVMFMPSQQETFGLSIIEGAACGMPVVVRDIHDYDDTFGDYAIRGNDSNFKDLITKLSTNQGFYRKYQQKSALLANKYDSRHTVSKLLSLYYKLIGQSS